MFREQCLRILRSPELEPKLEPPRGADSAAIGAIPVPDRPERSVALRMTGGSDRLPRPGKLGSPDARALCLARFAHHELMAAELFAWALLRWPDVPAGVRGAWRAALVDEQRHCRMYLDRLAVHDRTLADFAPHSDYFWRQCGVLEPTLQGACAFLAAMGLTLEQANLDFTLVYRDGFRQAGDEESARACQRVHDDEVGHVRLAAAALRELMPGEPDEVARYEAAVPFPLAASRAKGRRFEAEPRRRAGLGKDFIEHVRVARSNQELASCR